PDCCQARKRSVSGETDSVLMPSTPVIFPLCPLMSRILPQFRQYEQPTDHEDSVMRTVFAVLGCVLLVACSLSGGPPLQDVRTADIQPLPGGLAVVELALDAARNVGNDTAPVWVARLRAKVALREPPYDIETVVGGVRILKPVRAAGESFSV